MDRRLIRKRWQVTIPPDVRRVLSLYIGQLINWQVVTTPEGDVYIKIFSGSFVDREDQAAFQELFGGKKGRVSACRGKKKFRKSAEDREKRIEAWKNPQRFESSELRNLVSNLSQYLLSLQARLEALPGD